MKQFSDNITVWDEDEVILNVVEQLKQSGLKVPSLNTTKNFVIPIVTYKDCFILTIICYHSLKGDSGYVMIQIEDFLNNQEFNIESFSEITTVDEAEFLKAVKTQADNIASRIDYPYDINVVMDHDFTGLKAIPK